MFRWLGKLFPLRSHEAISLRRFEAAKTTRLNSSQWKDAADKPVNEDIALDVPTIRGRTQKLYHTDGFVQGVVNTHAADLVGEQGPTPQVESESEEWNRWAERVWLDWWNPAEPTLDSRPDSAGLLCGPDLLNLWMKGLWKNGEILIQLISPAERRNGLVSLRLNTVHPRRLRTPLAGMANGSIFAGIEVDKNGRPLRYHFEKYVPGELAAMSLEAEVVAAADVIHFFRHDEEGQSRGIPWLSPSLQPTADLRDYDDQVMDAARQAADWAVALWTNHPDATFMEVNESTEIERRTMSTCPPGWQPMGLTPPQPSTNYVEFRTERQREIGRPVGMPGLKIRCDASKHNYSSARFDDQGYAAQNASLAGAIERGVLNTLFFAVIREAELQSKSTALPVPPRPDRVRLAWSWPPRPHVDPEKEMGALLIELAETKTLSFGEACKRLNRDPEAVLRDIAKWDAQFKQVGIVPPWERPTGGGGEADPESRSAFRAQVLRWIREELEERGVTGWRE